MWIAIFIFILLGLCFIYDRSVEKNWKIDIYRDQSDWQEDESIINSFGFRYVQLAQFAAFLSFQALLSAVYGYTYGLAYVSWLVVGTTFLGAVLSYYGGMYALRNHGHTLNYIIKQKFGKYWHIASTLLLLSIISFLLSNSYHSFNKVYGGILNLPSHLLLIYCGCVVLFFSFCSARQMTILFSGVGIFAILALAYLLIGSKHQINLIEYGAHNFLTEELKYAFPLAFFVIALGSVNCLQGLQASLMAPMVKNEKLGRKVFFGAAVLQGVFLILLNALIAAWNPNIKDFQISLMNASSPYTMLQNVAFGAGGKKAMLLLFALSITLFLSFVACMTRLVRNLIDEIEIKKIKFLSEALTVALIALPVILLNRYNLKLSYVTVLAQMAGIFSCGTLIYFLKIEGKKYRHLVWPTILVLAALSSYIMLAIFKFTLALSNGLVASVLLISMICRALYRNREALKAKWKKFCGKYAEWRKIRKEKSLIRKQQKAEAKKIRLEKENRIKQEKALIKKQKEELKKQEKELKEKEHELETKENPKKESLALLIKQDETEGKNLEEQNLEKEIVRLTTEREEIDRRIKEIENKLEKEQSKRLLMETSESVVQKMQDEEDPVLIDEIEKLDKEISTNGVDVDLGTLINDSPKEEKPDETLPDFDFEFEGPKETIADKGADKVADKEAPQPQSKNKRNRRKSNNKKAPKDN